MTTKPTQSPVATRRRFLGCAAGALAVGAAPIREEPEEVVPLKSIVTTSGQEGLLELPWGRVLGRDKQKQKRLFSSPEIGPSNLFLVFGKDIDSAVEATYSAFVDGCSVESPVIPPGVSKDEQGGLWAFVYFGVAQSSPTEWTVTRVSIQRNRVRVTVSRPQGHLADFRVFDQRVYMMWAPLGKRNAEVFTLEVFDETQRGMTMTRRVVVAKS